MKRIKILVVLLVMLGTLPFGCQNQCPSGNEEYFNIRGIYATNRVQQPANNLDYLADDASVQWDNYRLHLEYNMSFFSMNDSWGNPFVNVAYAQDSWIRRDCKPAGSSGSKETLKNIRIVNVNGIQVWDSETNDYVTVPANTDISNLWNVYDKTANNWISLADYLAKTQSPLKESFGLVLALNKRIKAGDFKAAVEFSLTNGEKYTERNKSVVLY
ncbi:MAG: hypothetical protein ACKVTZ_02940 [Bacteroidia bacterium]